MAGVAAGRDLHVGTLNVLSDDGVPFGDLATRPGTSAEPCPYPGIAPFGEADAGSFYGREPDVDAVLDLLSGASLVAVVGSSGSGKSSLVAAGVIPALRRADPELRVTTIRPGRHPADRLPVSHGGPELVVVDQLEEVFDPRVDEDERRHFLDGLVTLARGRTSVLVGLRSDFFPHLDCSPAFAAAVSAAQRRLLPLGAEAIRDAVCRPAESVGLRVEDALVDEIIRAAASTASLLPLMSYALEEAWRRRRNGWLTLAGYAESGGVTRALDRGAERVWSRFSPEEQATAQRVLMRLAHLGENGVATRRQVAFIDLVTSVDEEGAVQTVVNRLAIARLLTVDLDHDTQTPIVDITHEAVLREWETFRGWLTRDRDKTRTREDLADSLRVWERHGRDPASLLGGTRLTAVEALRRSGELPVTAMEEHFLAASSRAARSQRLRMRVLIGLAASLVIALVAGSVAVIRQNEVQRQNTATDAAQQSRATIGDRRDLATLLAVAGQRTDDNPQTRAALVDALAGRDGPLTYMGAGGPRVSALAPIALPDGSVALGRADGTITLVSPTDGHETAPRPAGHTGAVTAIAVSGATMYSADAKGTILVHREGTAAPVGPPLVTQPVTALAVDTETGVLVGTHLDSPPSRWRTGNTLIPLPPLPADRAIDAVAAGAGLVVVADGSGAIRRFRADTGEALPDIAPPGSLAASAVTALALREDGRIAVADGSRLGVWDLRSAEPVPRWADAPGATSVSLPAVGDGMVVGDASGAIASWEVAASSLRAVQPVRRGLAGAVAGLVTGVDFLVATSALGSAASWDLSGRRSPAANPLLTAGSAVVAVATDSDGRIAAGGFDGRVLTTQGQLPDLGSAITALVFGPDHLLVVGTVDGQLLRADLTAGTVQAVAGQPGSRVAALVSSPGSGVVAGFSDGTVVQLDRPDRPLRAPSTPLTAMAVSPSGDQIAIASGEGTATVITVVRPADGDGGITTYRDQRLRVASLAFSPDGTMLASGSDDRSVVLWKIGSSTPVGGFAGHTDMIRGLVFSKDGSLLASGGEDGTIRLWDVARRSQIGAPLVFSGAFVWALTTTADGHSMLAANGDAIVEWPFDMAGWESAGCRFSGSAVSAAEWAAHAPAIALPTVCS